MIPPTSEKSVASSSVSQPPPGSKVYQIACIDDSPTVLDEIERGAD
jgi:hypothetical protein